MSDEQTQESLQLWDSIAPGWERHRNAVFEQQRIVSERLIEEMGARHGDTILELTCGPGETGLLLAERVPGARVVLSDFSPPWWKPPSAPPDRGVLRTSSAA